MKYHSRLPKQNTREARFKGISYTHPEAKAGSLIGAPLFLLEILFEKKILTISFSH